MISVQVYVCVCVCVLGIVCVSTRRSQLGKRLQQFTKGQPVLPAEGLGIRGGPNSHLEAVRSLDDALHSAQGLSHGPGRSGGGASRASQQNACEKLHTPQNRPPPNVLGGRGVARALRVGYEAVVEMVVGWRSTSEAADGRPEAAKRLYPSPLRAIGRARLAFARPVNT